MNEFWFLTTSNKPRLRDPTQAQKVIDKYWFDFDCEVKVEVDGKAEYRLSIWGDGWPAAWPLPPDTSPEEYCPDFDTPGQEEFAAFLTEVSPFLMERLIVHAIGTVNGQFPLSACEWLVDPHSTAIATTMFTSSADTADRASFSTASA